MLSLREYSKKRSRAEQTTRDYLARMGAKAMYVEGERVLSTGDMIRIEASLYLVECGLAVSTACRLVEMAAEGVIGSVADVHISFTGAQIDHTLETIRLDTGPASARILSDDGVDVVILTPV